MSVAIFISYSHQDASLVKPVVGLLRATKDLVFQDGDSIRPGNRWREQMEEALHVAHLVILFWCYHSSRSTEVRKEYEFALSTGKHMLPVLLDKTPLPEQLNEFQWVDFRQLVRLGHRSFKRWLAIAAAVSVLMMVGFLGVVLAPVLMPSKAERSLPLPIDSSQMTPAPSPRPPLPTEPVPQQPLPAPRASFPWSLIIFTVIVLALVMWLLRRTYRIRKKMATTLQEELFRRGISSA